MIEYFDQGHFNGRTLAERYCFLDFFTGTVALKNNSVSGFSSCSHFGDDAVSKRYVTTQVQPFLSRAVVWSKKDLPHSFAGFLESRGIVETRWNAPALVRQLGGEDAPPKRRGAKPTGAKQEFLRRYPDGKPDNLSAEAISAELTEAGFPISGRQVLNYSKEISRE